MYEKLKKYLNVTTVISFLLIMILSFFFINMIKKGEEPIVKEANLLAGKEIPANEVLDVNTGENQYEQLRNGKVLLVYFISGCDACKKEIQLINETNKKSNSETKIYGVMFEKKEAVVEYAEKQNVNFPILIDKDGKLLKELNLKYFPANLKLENGVIGKVLFGAPKNQEELSEFITSK